MWYIVGHGADTWAFALFKTSHTPYVTAIYQFSAQRNEWAARLEQKRQDSKELEISVDHVRVSKLLSLVANLTLCEAKRADGLNLCWFYEKLFFSIPKTALPPGCWRLGVLLIWLMERPRHQGRMGTLVSPWRQIKADSKGQDIVYCLWVSTFGRHGASHQCLIWLHPGGLEMGSLISASEALPDCHFSLWWRGSLTRTFVLFFFSTHLENRVSPQRDTFLLSSAREPPGGIWKRTDLRSINKIKMIVPH